LLLGSIPFVCVENAGRSKMAEAFARQLGLEAQSARTMPGKKVSPTVVLAMKEKGIDISGSRPRLLTLK
jgi:protein-tyrosine-phosphatase